MRAKIKFNFLSFWHAGSGMGRGSDVDSIVVKDRRGMPYLPGRSVKGLFREAVNTLEDINQTESGTTGRLFGVNDGERSTSQSGILFFTDAKIEVNYNDIAGDTGLKGALYERVSSTKISAEGSAVKGTLRAIELCVPVELIAYVDAPSKGDFEILVKAASLVRAAGAHRNRGLGRCAVALEAEVK